MFVHAAGCGREEVGDDARCPSAAPRRLCVQENVLLKVFIYQRAAAGHAALHNAPDSRGVAWLRTTCRLCKTVRLHVITGEDGSCRKIWDQMKGCKKDCKG